jgi:hypothetical protein
MRDHDDHPDAEDVDRLEGHEILGRLALGRAWFAYVTWQQGDRDDIPGTLCLWRARRGEDGRWRLLPGPSLYVRGLRALNTLLDLTGVALRRTEEWTATVKLDRPPRRADW